jgi:signal transduction histidine kinase
MARMVEDLLGFAHGHLGEGIPVEPVPGDLGEIVRTAVDEARAANPDRPIKVEISGELRGSWDRGRVQQAFGNLIGNAIQYGTGAITVVARADGPRAVVTEVANSGEPIPAEVLPVLFDPFRRGKQTAKKQGGLGLGLYIVREIALAHGATIDVTSTAASGTRFTLRWPRTLPGNPGATPDPRG